MDTEHLRLASRAAWRGSPPPGFVFRDLGAQARAHIGGEAQRGSEGSLSPAVEWFEERAAVIEFEAREADRPRQSMALRRSRASSVACVRGGEGMHAAIERAEGMQAARPPDRRAGKGQRDALVRMQRYR